MVKLSKFFILVIAVIGLITSAHAQTEDSLLEKLNIPGVFARKLDQLYGQSATFRAQCDRLVRAQSLRLSVKVDNSTPQSCRAFTIIRRTRGLVCAEVHLPVTGQFAELVAHEFEHIIEQLEHVDLRKLATVRRSGVRQVGFEIFETDRAQLAGRVVAEELRSVHARRPSAY